MAGGGPESTQLKTIIKMAAPQHSRLACHSRVTSSV